MKKVYIFLAAICLAAMTSCIKEDLNIAEEVILEVSLDTREGTQGSSLNQGDKIKDAMVWVFNKDNDDACVGYRTFTAAENTYAQIPLEMHVPVPTCNGSANYRVVAVLNREKWGTLANSFGSGTTYAQLTAAKFANDELMSSVVSDNPAATGGTPNVMPASHWCDVTVYGKDYKNNQDTPMNNHPGHCAVANLNVFRAVAKTQLFVSKATNDFKLEITGVQVMSANAPNKGMVLSSVAADALAAENGNPTATWFGSLDDTSDYTANFSQPLKSANGDPATLTVPAGTATATNGSYVGAAFLYENPDGWTISDWTSHDCSNAPEGAGLRDDETSATEFGYYMEVKYKINDGAETTSYVPLPSVVRNHDYQVRALIDAGGKLSLSLVVNEWDVDDDNNWNFTDNVSVTANGKLSWDVEGNDNVKINEAETQITLPQTGINTNNKAQCKFTFDTPRDGAKWMASFVGGDVNAFKFIDENGNLVNTISGTIDGEESILTICTTENSVKDTKQAELDIVVVTGDGRTLSASVVFKNGRPMIIQELTM